MNRDAWRDAGQAHLAKGQLRRALGAFRRALELDTRGERSFELHQLVDAATQVLSHRGAYFLHPSDETARSRWLEAGAPALAEPDFAALAQAAFARGKAELLQVFESRTLRVGLAGQRLCGDDDAARAGQLFLYEALLTAEE